MTPLPYAAQRLAVLMSLHELGLHEVEPDDVLLGDRATFAFTLRRAVRYADLAAIAGRFGTHRIDLGAGDAERTVVPGHGTLIVVRDAKYS